MKKEQSVCTAKRSQAGEFELPAIKDDEILAK